MPNFLPVQAIIFFLASFFTTTLIYFKIEISWLQRIVAVILLILLILLNKFLNPSNTEKISGKVSKISLLLSTVFVQLIVISTGGFKSPFLALIHIFALGISFLINLPSALVFLALSLFTIFANFWFDKNIQSLFLDDPGSILLYLVSFVVIVPLSILVTRYYYLKDAVAKVLSREVRTKELQQELVLQGLNELVVVTNKDLIVVSANESAEKMLSSTGAVILKRPIFDVLFLKDESERMMDKISLKIDEMLQQKEAKQFSNLFLYVRNSARPRKVTLTVKPIVNLEGSVDQISFVISDNSRSFTDSKVGHVNLEEARTKSLAAIASFRDKLNGSDELIQRLEILIRMEQDLQLATEIEDHVIGEKPQLTDIAELSKRAVMEELNLAKLLKVNLNFSILNFNSTDTEKIAPRGLNISPINLTAPFFTAPIDVKWFNILVSKLLDLLIIFSSGVSNATVLLSIDREGESIIIVNISSNSEGLSDEEKKLLLTQYYGLLNNITNLKFGSGLEGFISKQIAISLNIPLEIISQKGTPGVNIKLRINRKAVD